MKGPQLLLNIEESFVTLSVHYVKLHVYVVREIVYVVPAPEAYVGVMTVSVQLSTSKVYVWYACLKIKVLSLALTTLPRIVSV